MPPLGGLCQNTAITFDMERKREWCNYPTVKKFDDMFSRFDTILVCDTWADRRTSGDGTYTEHHVVKICPKL